MVMLHKLSTNVIKGLIMKVFSSIVLAIQKSVKRNNKWVVRLFGWNYNEELENVCAETMNKADDIEEYLECEEEEEEVFVDCTIERENIIDRLDRTLLRLDVMLERLNEKELKYGLSTRSVKEISNKFVSNKVHIATYQFMLDKERNLERIPDLPYAINPIKLIPHLLRSPIHLRISEVESTYCSSIVKQPPLENVEASYFEINQTAQNESTSSSDWSLPTNTRCDSTPINEEIGSNIQDIERLSDSPNIRQIPSQMSNSSSIYSLFTDTAATALQESRPQLDFKLRPVVGIKFHTLTLQQPSTFLQRPSDMSYSPEPIGTFFNNSPFLLSPFNLGIKAATIDSNEQISNEALETNQPAEADLPNETYPIEEITHPLRSPIHLRISDVEPTYCSSIVKQPPLENVEASYFGTNQTAENESMSSSDMSLPTNTRCESTPINEEIGSNIQDIERQSDSPNIRQITSQISGSSSVYSLLIDTTATTLQKSRPQLDFKLKPVVGIKFHTLTMQQPSTFLEMSSDMNYSPEPIRPFFNNYPFLLSPLKFGIKAAPNDSNEHISNEALETNRPAEDEVVFGHDNLNLPKIENLIPTARKPKRKRRLLNFLFMCTGRRY